MIHQRELGILIVAPAFQAGEVGLIPTVRSSLWSIRLVARITGFHPVEAGSKPAWTTSRVVELHGPALNIAPFDKVEDAGTQPCHDTQNPGRSGRGTTGCQWPAALVMVV